MEIKEASICGMFLYTRVYVYIRLPKSGKTVHRFPVAEKIFRRSVTYQLFSSFISMYFHIHSLEGSRTFAFTLINIYRVIYR